MKFLYFWKLDVVQNASTKVGKDKITSSQNIRHQQLFWTLPVVLVVWVVVGVVVLTENKIKYSDECFCL